MNTPMAALPPSPLQGATPVARRSRFHGVSDFYVDATTSR